MTETPVKLGNHLKKTFSCKTCGKNYSETLSLKNHIKIVHEGAKIYSCNLCDKMFGSRVKDYLELNRHYKTVHENQEKEVLLPNR